MDQGDPVHLDKKLKQKPGAAAQPRFPAELCALALTLCVPLLRA